MGKGIKASVVLLFFLASILYSCKNNDPSAVKIFVRSASNELVAGAKVVIIGDLNSNPPTNEYVDTVITNESGFALFNLKAYYDQAGDDNEVAYFDVVVKTDTKQQLGYIRSRSHTTAVETIFLPN